MTARSILIDRRVLYALAWFLAIALAVARIINGQLAFQASARADGNIGHCFIDFGGQWMMGRMLASGHGQELFSRPRQWEVIERAYTPDHEAPGAAKHDPGFLIQFFMGDDDPRWLDFAGATAALIGSTNPYEQAAIAIQSQPEWAEPRLHELTHPTQLGIGGPLYPPIHAFVMCPFALGDHPQAAYCAMQYVQTLFCFVAGLGVSRLSRGRFWWPLASALILIYPGCRGAVDLGQNSPMTLTILIWGWLCLARKRPALGGLLWGLLAYKPIWAVSFFLLLLLIRQWRAALTMALTGVALILATLPFVGIHTWLHWLTVGQEAARIYNVDSNWIPLSRDVLTLPRRILLDFSLPRSERDRVVARAACWAVWALVLEIALRAYCLRGRRSLSFTGPTPALLILTAWMCTYHFMYYDALLSAFGVCVLLADPRPFFRPRILRAVERASAEGSRSILLVNSFVLTLVALLLLQENSIVPLKIEITGVAHAITSQRTLHDGTTELAPRLIVGASDRYPVDTLLVIAIWAWCAIVTLAGSWKEELPTMGLLGRAGEES